jgi:hypothetical protein
MNVYCLKCCVRADTKTDIDAVYVPPLLPAALADLAGRTGYVAVQWYPLCGLNMKADSRCAGLHACKLSSVGHVNLIMYSTEKCSVFILLPFTS